MEALLFTCWASVAGLWIDVSCSTIDNKSSCTAPIYFVKPLNETICIVED